MIKIKYIFCLFIAVYLFSGSCVNLRQTSPAEGILHAYRKELKELSGATKQLIFLLEHASSTAQIQKQFILTRAAYKKVEWLAEYYYPYTAKKINGPALPEVEADEKSIIVQPEGFQVIEEMLFRANSEVMPSTILQQAKLLQSNVGRLDFVLTTQETTDANIFDALRLEVFRIISLGITGFDSPVANNSLPEADASIESIAYYLSFYREKINSQNKYLYDSLQILLKDTRSHLSQVTSFDSFDRMKVIKDYLNPISEKIARMQDALKIPFFKEPRALKAEASTLFAKDIFNVDYYTPNIQSYSSQEKIKLGRKLFYDGILSGDGTRSCATCHQPAKAFSDGLVTSSAVGGRTSISRNAPTLLNAALQPSLFYDMRVNYLEDQAKDVISNKNEMHGSFANALTFINGDTAYRQLFKKVYKDEEPSDLHIKNSIAAYVRSLTALNSRFDQYMRGSNTVMNQIEIDGFNIFTGKAKCATCHFIPLFNGANPPAFSKTDAEVIGVPATADSLHPAFDTDKGKYNLYKVPLHKNAFKTPTIRNVELTAPYMHNGVFKSLEEVVEFYNKGGGTGWGLHLENQTLPTDKLHLNTMEKQSLVAFMKSLTDTVVNVYR